MKQLVCMIVFAAILLGILVAAQVSNSQTTITESQSLNEIYGSSEISNSGKSKYFLFKTGNVQEYLNFLETFDETHYELVDISTSYQISVKGSDDFYMVTYKTLLSQ